MVQKDNCGNNRNRDLGGRTGQARWAEAEKEVGRLLSTLLLDGCLVLNDVPFPYGNLDHVVIRQDGVIFLVETKSHRGRVTWNGKRLLINNRPFSSNPICQINRSIRWVRKIAQQIFRRNPWIVSVLVFPNAKVAVNRSVKRVNVMTAEDLISFIRNYPTLAE
jgi:hypothetical protein